MDSPGCRKRIVSFQMNVRDILRYSLAELIEFASKYSVPLEAPSGKNSKHLKCDYIISIITNWDEFVVKSKKLSGHSDNLGKERNTALLDMPVMKQPYVKKSKISSASLTGDRGTLLSLPDEILELISYFLGTYRDDLRQFRLVNKALYKRIKGRYLTDHIKRRGCDHNPSCFLVASLGCCCWCCDTRNEEEKMNPLVYIDGLGMVRAIDHGVRWPVDAGYCEKCQTPHTKRVFPKLKRALCQPD